MKKTETIKRANKELFEKGNLDVISEVFTSNYLCHAGDKDYRGHNFIKRWTEQLRGGLQDLSVRKVEILLEQDNTISWLRVLSGTHIASIRGIKGTNQKIEWSEMVVSHFEDGKIAEEWVVSELLGQLLSKYPLK